MTSETWVFRVTAHPSESLGHFLGRFRRANELSHKAIAAHLGVNVAWVKDWEIPSRRRNPTELQIIALSKLVEVPPQQLRQMQPPDRLHLQTRLCPLCYAETPAHRVTWQQLGVDECTRHQLPLLKACPACRTGFRTPALWNNEPCLGCGRRFEHMGLNQVDQAIEPS